MPLFYVSPELSRKNQTYNIIIGTRLFTLNTFIKLLHKNSEY